MYSFPVNEEEQIIHKGMATLEVEGHPLNGALYLTNERLVFIGYELDITRKYMEEILLEHIDTIREDKTLWVIPNVIRVSTITGRKHKLVLNKREKWLREIRQRLNG